MNFHGGLFTDLRKNMDDVFKKGLMSNYMQNTPNTPIMLNDELPPVVSLSPDPLLEIQETPEDTESVEESAQDRKSKGYLEGISSINAAERIANQPQLPSSINTIQGLMEMASGGGQQPYKNFIAPSRQRWLQGLMGG